MMKNTDIVAQFWAATPDGCMPYLVFDVHDCDSCGDPILAPNSLQVSHPIGKEQWTDSIPQEGGLCTALGPDWVTCEDCWVADPDDE